MTIIEDMANKAAKHVIKNRYWIDIGVDVIRAPLPVGDYILTNDKTEDVMTRKAKRGIALKKMDFLGTYSISVDTKENMQEIVGNICGKSHDRFRDECLLAQNNKIKLYILIENEDGISCMEDVKLWHNPRLDIYTRDWNNPIGYFNNGNVRYGKKRKYPSATKGLTLFKAMYTMQEKYGVEFLFCTPAESGAKIIELLDRKE